MTRLLVATTALAVTVVIIARAHLLRATSAELLVVISREVRLTVPMRSIRVATLALSIPSPSVTTIVEQHCMVLHLLHHCFRSVPLESRRGSALPLPSTIPMLPNTLLISRHGHIRIEHQLPLEILLWVRSHVILSVQLAVQPL